MTTSKQIKSLAKQVLRQYWDRALPVDPTAIAQAMNVVVTHDPKLGQLSGWFQLTGNGPTIRINPDEAMVRQRFTVAHELGHYVLSHGDSLRDPSHNFSMTNYDTSEVEANRFAAELLMPEEAIEQLAKNKNLTDLAELASRFQVSQVAMRYRLKSLGWISA